MDNKKQQFRVLAELVEAASQLVAEAARHESMRAFGRSHGEPQLAQYAVLTGLKLEDYASSLGIELDRAIALESRSFGAATSVESTDLRITISILHNVTMLAAHQDQPLTDLGDAAAKIGRVFVELDQLSEKCGTDLRATMRAGREAADRLFSEYRCPTP